MTQEEYIYELKKKNEILQTEFDELQDKFNELTDKYCNDFHNSTKLLDILSKIETDLRTIATRI